MFFKQCLNAASSTFFECLLDPVISFVSKSSIYLSREGLSKNNENSRKK